MTIDPRAIQQWDAMMTELDKLIHQHEPVIEQEGSFLHIIEAISAEAVDNYHSLRQAYFNDAQTPIAWACRNLLELAVFAEFVIESNSNAKTFAEDRLIDGHQIDVLVQRLEEWGGVSSHAQATVDLYVKQIKSENIARTDFTPVHQMAKGGLKKEFSTVNKLCSKLVHPTAWSLLTNDKKAERFPQASEILFVFGAKYFMTLCAAFMPHIRQYGLRPKPL
jgi:hypothetical protein